MANPTVERMKARAGQRAQRAKDAAQPAYANVYCRMNVKIRDELPMLRGAPLAVLVYLASRMGKNSQCNPRIELIALQTGYSKRQVQRALSFLRNMGYIWFEVQTWLGNEGRQPSNRYKLTKAYITEDKTRFPLFVYGRITDEGK